MSPIIPSQSAGRAHDFVLPSDKPTVVGPQNQILLRPFMCGYDISKMKTKTRDVVSKACRVYAATIREVPPKPKIVAAWSREESAQTQSPLGNTHAGDILTRTSINYRLWKETDDTRYLNSTLDSFTQLNTNRLYSSQYNDWGEAAFFHDKMDEPLSYEAMSSLVTEFKPASPTYTDLNKEIVQAVRRVLWTEKIDDSPMLASVPRSSLFFFLQNCQLQIKPDDDDQHQETASTVRCTFSDVDIPGSGDEQSANRELSDWLVAVSEHLRTIQSLSRAHADAMTEKHGLVLSKSIDDVMAQLNNAIDVSALRAVGTAGFNPRLFTRQQQCIPFPATGLRYSRR
ncbi:hypothetical protein FPHYL_4902 [Fusarium phyllophilum]|uniref:Uncharacterized protein n=1 Tax=Fusarium phyllophilum TaxID=47803 RepID=A0A8H5NGM6_9HYPO|nr:hypothetical protein FPHYL_4902 [Fusarium phyllophilum]